MNLNLRDLAGEWEVDPEPLIEALASAQHERRYRQGQQSLIASAEPAEANHRLRQAHKGIAALPLRAKAALHWGLAERITSSIPGLDPEQLRRVMESTNWPELILDALCVEVEPAEENRELQWLVQAWVEAGGRINTDDYDERYNPDLIEFLALAFSSLGDRVSNDGIRLRLDRLDP